MDFSFEDGPEAREWLQANSHDAAMAVNHFSTTAAALEFVEQLYVAGAKRVFIPRDTIVDDSDELELGGPYADTMVIEVESADVSPTLEALYRAEATLEGWDRRRDPLPLIGGCYLFILWD